MIYRIYNTKTGEYLPGEYSTQAAATLAMPEGDEYIIHEINYDTQGQVN